MFKTCPIKLKFFHHRLLAKEKDLFKTKDPSSALSLGKMFLLSFSVNVDTLSHFISDLCKLCSTGASKLFSRSRPASPYFLIGGKSRIGVFATIDMK